jgi:hypothetical protein
MNKSKLRKWRENYTPFTGTCLHEGLKLNVHFDEKDHIKRLGAMWYPDPSGKGGYWWMPANRHVGSRANRLLRDMKKCGFGDTFAIVNIFDPDAYTHDVMEQTTDLTILDWLNRNKMISGEFHGTLLDSLCDDAAVVGESETYLLHMDDGNTMKFDEYSDLGIVLLSSKGGSDWSTTENARKIWNELVRQGAVRDVSVTNT